MFAAGLGVLILGVGAALDLSGRTSQNSKLQSMADAAALAAVTSGETKYAALKKFVEASFAANNVDNLEFKWDLKITNETVTVEMKSLYDTNLMGSVGKDVMPVGVLSEAQFPEETPINISLVLDTTVAMLGEKMDGLKAAAAVLVDQFAEYEADTRVAVVPFAKYLNVNVSRRNENWWLENVGCR